MSILPDLIERVARNNTGNDRTLDRDLHQLTFDKRKENNVAAIGPRYLESIDSSLLLKNFLGLKAKGISVHMVADGDNVVILGDAANAGLHPRPENAIILAVLNAVKALT